MTLCEIADLDRRTDPAHPLVGLAQPRDNRAEHRLPGTVGPDHADPFAPVDLQVTPEQYGVAPEGHGYVAERHDLRAPTIGAAHLERDPTPLEDRLVDLVHPVDLALLVPGLRDVSLVHHDPRPVFEAFHRLLEARDLLLLRDVELLLALERDLLRDRVRGVVAGPHRDATGIELGDRRDRLVEQVAVVRDRHDGTGELVHDRLEPSPPIRVEMGLGLVEQQQVGLADQAGRERDELALAAGERPGGQRQVIVVETEGVEGGARLTREAGAARFHPPIEQDLLPREHPIHAGQVADDLRTPELGLHGPHLGVERGDVGTSGEHGLFRRPVVAVGMLLEVGDGEILAPDHLAAGRRFATFQDAEECRFARAVRPDDADPARPRAPRGRPRPARARNRRTSRRARGSRRSRPHDTEPGHPVPRGPGTFSRDRTR